MNAEMQRSKERVLMLHNNVARNEKGDLALFFHDLDGVVPTEIQLIPYGVHDTPKYGKIVVDDESLTAIMNERAKRKNDDVIDYEHQTFADPPIIAPAAGWIKKLINKGKDGIWGVIEWTEKARQMIVNKEYRYFSPITWTRKKDGKVLDLMGGGLTNFPNIDGMVPLINKREFRADAEIQNHKEDTAMLQKLLELLGLPAETTEEQLLEAIAKLKEAATAKPEEAAAANKAVLDALGLKEDAKESEITGTILAMKQSHTQHGDLSKTVQDLIARNAQRDADEAVTLAINDGKITPAQKPWATDYAKRDLAGFQVFVSKAPVVVRTDKIVKDEKGGGEQLDDTQVQVNKMLGISDETFKKHNKAA